MHYAIIDIGSNNVRLVIYRQRRHKFTVIFNEKRTIGLINQIEAGQLSADAIEQLLEVLDQFRNMSEVFNADQLRVFATASLREAENREAILALVQERLGLEIDIISRADEAYFAYLGVRRSGLMDSNLFMKALSSGKSAYIMDCGGGSTEVVQAAKGEFESAKIMPFGSLSLRKQFLPGLVPTIDEMVVLDEFVKKEVDVYFSSQPDRHLFIGVGGTARLLARIDRFHKGKRTPSHGYQLTFDDLEEMYLEAISNPAGLQEKVFKICLTRVHTVLTGIIAFYHVAKTLRADDILISRFGVREGYLVDKMMSEEDREKCVLDMI